MENLDPALAEFTGASSWRGEALRLLVTAGAALVALYLLMAQSTLPVVILCVVSIGLIAWYADGWWKPGNTVLLRDKAVFITGCDTGFGRQLALSLDEQGVQVFAGCLHPHGDGARSLAAAGSERLCVLQCDVTDMDSITQAKEYVIKNLTDRVLWGIVNNAGINFRADVELTSMKYFERVNDVNYLGMVRVTKQFLPLVRQSKGRIVNVTSVKGRIPTPFCAAYTSAKWAGEAFSDILRLEMHRFGVKVCVIEPGHYGGATAMIDMTRIDAELRELWEQLPEEGKHTYGEGYIQTHLKCTENEQETSGRDLSRVTAVMVQALFDLNPKTRYLIPGGAGFVDWFMLKAVLKSYLPDRVMDFWLRREFASFKS